MSDAVLFEQAIELSRQLMDSIGRQDLDEIMHLHQRRQEVVGRIYAASPVDEDQTRLLLKLNKQITEYLKSYQNLIQQQQLDIKHGARAAKAYQALTPIA